MYAKTWHSHTHTTHQCWQWHLKNTQLNPSLHKQTRLKLYNPESQWRTQSENEKAEHKAITGLCWPSQPKPKQLKSHRYLSPLSLPHSSDPSSPPLPNRSGETRKINPRKIHHSRHLLLFWAAIGCISCIRTKRDNSFFPFSLPSVSPTASSLADWAHLLCTPAMCVSVLSMKTPTTNRCARRVHSEQWSKGSNSVFASSQQVPAFLMYFFSDKFAYLKGNNP